MSASLDCRPKSSKATAASLCFAFGLFGLALLFTMFLAVMELANAGENVLIETWPGWILILAVASGGIYTTYTELLSCRDRPLARPKMLIIGCSLCLIAALFAMNSAIMFRLTNGG